MIMISDSAKSQRVNQAFLRSFSSRFLRSRVPQVLSAPFRPARPPARRGHARRFCPAKNLIVGKLTRLTAPSASERLLSWRREIVHRSATIHYEGMIKYTYFYPLLRHLLTYMAVRPRPRPYWECHETLQGDCN